MNVLLFGATGMVGRGVLLECLRDPAVARVVAVGRRPVGLADPKLREVVQDDVAALDALGDELRGVDACLFCLGVSAAGLSEAGYARLTHDLTLAVARQLVSVAPGATFVYVSGMGTDGTERGRTMWARVKGRTENALLALPFRAAYMMRPGLIRPLDGIRSSTRLYRVLYAAMAPVLPLLRRVRPTAITDTRELGRAMLRVAREGWPRRILEMRDIVDAGRETPR